MVDTAELRRMISETGLDAYTDEIVAAAQWAIRIDRMRMADDSMIAIGASKLGGSPDVPAGFVWPEWNGTPLTFLAQFRLSDVAPFDVERALPPSGYLYFFYEADSQPWGTSLKDTGFFKVEYVEDENVPLHRYAHPVVPDMYRFTTGFRPCAVSFSARLMVAELHAEHIIPQLRGNTTTPVDIPSVLHWSDTEGDQYWKLEKALSSGEPRHWLLGYPITIQWDMRSECQFVTNNAYDDKTRQKELEPGIPEWRLLLQIDTDDGDDGFGGIWGDVGTLYYWIQKQDLAARDFSKCWMILQCT